MKVRLGSSLAGCCVSILLACGLAHAQEKAGIAREYVQVEKQVKALNLKAY